MNNKKEPNAYPEGYPLQIGCGYCHVEKECEKRDGKTNFAKLCCKEFKHYKSE